MVLIIILYFALASAALALLLLPPARSHLVGWAQCLIVNGTSLSRRATQGGRRHVSHAAQAIGGVSSRSTSWIDAHRRGMSAALLLLLFAPLVPLALRGYLQLDGYDHRLSRETNEQVAALLVGEQLVPPPPVPPELFTAHEVEQARPMIGGASREWELLDRDFRQRLLVVFKLMHERYGYDLVLLEGYRSPERQARLASLGPKVTRAGAFASYHQFGLAADCAFMRDGRISISEADAWTATAYEKYGELARSVGLTWGGGWKSIKDFGHIELQREGVLQHRTGA